MATFARASFSAASYAAFRPSYTPKIFSTVLTYHSGPSNLLVDLGCGHGPIARELSSFFTQVLGTDPSPAMIKQAQSSTPPDQYPNVRFLPGHAQDLDDVEDGSVDMVIAGQAAHWFDYAKVWPVLGRKVRKGGTLAFLGYKDNLFVEHPAATKVLDHYCYGETTMGPYWEQPGRNMLRDKYRDIKPPTEAWESVERIEYEPGVNGKGSGTGEPLMFKRLKLGEVEAYARTFSSYWNWIADHPDRKAKKDGGPGDIVDEMFEKMVQAEEAWKEKGDAWRDIEVENEWGSVILLARRK